MIPSVRRLARNPRAARLAKSLVACAMLAGFLFIPAYTFHVEWVAKLASYAIGAIFVAINLDRRK